MSGSGVGAVDIQVRVQPRARRDELLGLRDGRLLVGVTAPPVDGKANAAVRKVLANAAGIPPTRVSVVRGERSRDKLVRFEGVEDPDALRARLGVSPR